MSEEETIAFNVLLNTVEEISHGEMSYLQARLKAKTCLNVVSKLLKEFEIKRNLWANQQIEERT